MSIWRAGRQGACGNDKPDRAPLPLQITFADLNITSLPAFSHTCAPAQLAKMATATEIQSFVRHQTRRVVTFTGESGAEYKDTVTERGLRVFCAR